MSEASVASLGVVEGADGLPFRTDVFFDDELGYAFAVRDGVGGVGEVYGYDADLASIVGVDGAWGY